MKKQFIFVISIAVTASTFLYSTSARAEDAAADASQLMPAQAVLNQTIDGKKVQPGQKFDAKLSETVHLKNGTVLPKGTELEGTVSAGDAQAGGAESLNLQFTEAKLKGGKTIPVEAMIVDLLPPTSDADQAVPDDQKSLDEWDGKSPNADVVGVLSGVDLHSALAAQNSGVFTSTKKGDLRLASGSQLALAITAGN